MAHERSRLIWLQALRNLPFLFLSTQAGCQQDSDISLLQHYQMIMHQLAAWPNGPAMQVNSTTEGQLVQGEVYALLMQPFSTLTDQLAIPDVWCKITLLHLNIKACTREFGANAPKLTLYSGHKFYEPPEKAYPLHLLFQQIEVRPLHLELHLSADTGPLNTSNYRLSFSAIPVAEGSFVRVSYAFGSSFLSRIATGLYLSTQAQNKVGFTIVGTSPEGSTVYVDGTRGIVERNAVRYYFAILAYLDSVSLPRSQQFEFSMHRWFELTEQFPIQLHEIELQEYLNGKRLERQEQNRLQATLDAKNGYSSRGEVAPESKP